MIETLRGGEYKVDSTAVSYILELKGITKEFSGIRVLDNVDFDLRKGEVHIIVGENGAGKSTLVKILTGVYSKDQGKIFINGKEVQIHNRNDATRNGIAIVFQEFSLIPTLSVAENIFVGHLPVSLKLGGLLRIVDWKTILDRSKHFLEDFGVNIDPMTKTRTLGIAVQQLVEILKALMLNAQILIMDEPTATLSKFEIEHLFHIIGELKKNGVSIIYISHRLNEINLIGDRVTVLKDGCRINTLKIAETSTKEIIHMMIGRNISDIYPKKENVKKREILKVENLSLDNQFRRISFQVHEGEILGITGLVGSGKTELANTLFGILRRTSGNVFVNDKKIDVKSPVRAISLGLGLLPEDRKQKGIILPLNIQENMSLPNLEQFMKFRIISLKKERRTVKKYMDVVHVRPNDPKKKVRFLSGGNQQKVVLSKWLCSQSKLFIFDEPTRGIDIGSKMEIYKLMNYLSQSGCGIVMISSEIPEIIGMCNRILVMRKGEITNMFHQEGATSDMILQASIGDSTQRSEYQDGRTNG